MMGYNTALMICNDGMDQLKKDPLAGEKLHTAILHGEDDRWVSIGNHVNCATVLRSQHADYTQVVLVGQNTIRSATVLWGGIGYDDENITEALFARLAEDLGYNVSKKAWRKRKDARATASPPASPEANATTSVDGDGAGEGRVL